MLGYLVFRNPLHTSNMLEGRPFFLLLGVSIYSYLPIEEKKRKDKSGYLIATTTTCFQRRWERFN